MNTTHSYRAIEPSLSIVEYREDVKCPSRPASSSSRSRWKASHLNTRAAYLASISRRASSFDYYRWRPSVYSTSSLYGPILGLSLFIVPYLKGLLSRNVTDQMSNRIRSFLYLRISRISTLSHEISGDLDILRNRVGHSDLYKWMDSSIRRYTTFSLKTFIIYWFSFQPHLI